jgi:hypothetical protein
MTTSKQLAAKYLTGVPVYVGRGFDSGVLMNAVEDAIDAGKEELRQAVVAALKMEAQRLDVMGRRQAAIDVFSATSLPILAPPKPELSQRALGVAKEFLDRGYQQTTGHLDLLARIIQDEYGA